MSRFVCLYDMSRISPSITVQQTFINWWFLSACYNWSLHFKTVFNASLSALCVLEFNYVKSTLFLPSVFGFILPVIATLSLFWWVLLLGVLAVCHVAVMCLCNSEVVNMSISVYYVCSHWVLTQSVAVISLSASSWHQQAVNSIQPTDWPLLLQLSV